PPACWRLVLGLALLVACYSFGRAACPNLCRQYHCVFIISGACVEYSPYKAITGFYSPTVDGNKDAKDDIGYQYRSCSDCVDLCRTDQEIGHEGTPPPNTVTPPPACGLDCSDWTKEDNTRYCYSTT